MANIQTIKKKSHKRTQPSSRLTIPSCLSISYLFIFSLFGYWLYPIYVLCAFSAQNQHHQQQKYAVKLPRMLLRFLFIVHVLNIWRIKIEMFWREENKWQTNKNNRDWLRKHTYISLMRRCKSMINIILRWLQDVCQKVWTFAIRSVWQCCWTICVWFYFSSLYATDKLIERMR